jgi:hypothetical protein
MTRTYPSRDVVVVSHSQVGGWLGNIIVRMPDTMIAQLNCKVAAVSVACERAGVAGKQRSLTRAGDVEFSPVGVKVQYFAISGEGRMGKSVSHLRMVMRLDTSDLVEPMM